MPERPAGESRLPMPAARSRVPMATMSLSPGCPTAMSKPAVALTGQPEGKPAYSSHTLSAVLPSAPTSLPLISAPVRCMPARGALIL